jgi:hypothetical protein
MDVPELGVVPTDRPHPEPYGEVNKAPGGCDCPDALADQLEAARLAESCITVDVL